jgi:nucleotide-binding universal stress UspA family protein
MPTTSTTSVYRSLSKSPILVPLDGSARAESALPVAQQLAERLGAPLMLVRVVPVTLVPFASSSMPLPPESYQQLVDDERRLATEYLKRQAQPLRESGLTARILLAEGDASSTLLDICSSEQVGLVVMTTHGRTGLVRFTLGSVADRLVRYSHIPVLLLRSFGTSNTSGWNLDRLLVPLDGSALAETALPLMWELAGAVAHDITLERVVPFTADEDARALAKSYLEAHARELQGQLASQECKVSFTVREGTVPAEKIIEAAEEKGCLVVMATHGWGGMKRWVLGSVADQVVHLAQVPVLLVHTGESASSSELAEKKKAAVSGGDPSRQALGR